MRYYVILKTNECFSTNWFQFENHWTDDILCVLDWGLDRITFNGEVWQEIERDHL